MGVAIRQDAEGRYCLNDCHKASGGKAAKKPANFLRLDTTRDLMAEISHFSDVRSGPLSIVTGGNSPGTYACKELIYAYAMWISPAFHLMIIRVFDALVTQQTEQANAIIREAFAIVAPKAKAYDRIAGMDGLMTLRQAAKELGWPERKFIALLHEMKWIYRQGGSGPWIGYADKTQAGYVDYKHYDQRDSEGHIHPRAQVVITTKGIARLARILPEFKQAA
ncbi:phage antirepressor KilAC domain-containing protein [Acetobacter orleanensis]|nr:phage antirepressor KilAC domain-containing protein [Acetobacter orleanensis]